MSSPEPTPEPAFLVFGDLHGRVLPAFRLAISWSRDHGRPLDGILQIGDLGYFPDLSRLDRATIRHAADDPLELGVQDVVAPSDLADATFSSSACPPGMWFTAGNHEDFAELEHLGRQHSRSDAFPVDHYAMVHAIHDGRVVEFDNGLRVAALWGVDGEGAHRRTNLPERGYIRSKSVDRLLTDRFDVLLTHDAPKNAKRFGCGSELLASLIDLARPRFAFFGHYKGDGGRSPEDFGQTEVYHLAGFELRTRDGTPEPGSVGLLERVDGVWQFEFLERAWTKTFSRHNWKWRGMQPGA